MGTDLKAASGHTRGSPAHAGIDHNAHRPDHKRGRPGGSPAHAGIDQSPPVLSPMPSRCRFPRPRGDRPRVQPLIYSANVPVGFPRPRGDRPSVTGRVSVGFGRLGSPAHAGIDLGSDGTKGLEFDTVPPPTRG